MCDFNAKIGSDNVGGEHVMDREGLGQINENGKLFVCFSVLCIVIGGSLFQHKRIHKATWISSDHHTRRTKLTILLPVKGSQDYCKDTRVRRGAVAASDHHLVVGHLKQVNP